MKRACRKRIRHGGATFNCRVTDARARRCAGGFNSQVAGEPALVLRRSVAMGNSRASGIGYTTWKAAARKKGAFSIPACSSSVANSGPIAWGIWLDSRCRLPASFCRLGGVKPVTSGWRGPAVPPYRSAAQRVSDERHDHTHAQSVKGVGDDQPLQDPILPVQLAASIDPVAGRVAAGSGSLAMSVTAPTRPGR